MNINLNNAMWLAGRQIRDIWPSFIWTAVYFAFMGAILATDTSLAIEIAHPILMIILIQPAVSSRYMTLKTDNEVARHQQFLRSVPLGFGTIVGARLFGMLVAGAVNIPFYFVWFWYFKDDWSSLGAFLAWVVFWVGIAIGFAGLSLISEFWLNMRRWVSFNSVVIFVYIVSFPSVLWLTDARPVQRTMDLAQESPWMMAIGGLFIGITALVGCMYMAVSCFRRREFAV